MFRDIENAIHWNSPHPSQTSAGAVIGRCVIFLDRGFGPLSHDIALLFNLAQSFWNSNHWPNLASPRIAQLSHIQA